MKRDPSLNPGADTATGAAQAALQRQLVLTVALGTMLAPLNSTMIAVALPKVVAEFGVSMVTAGWLVTAYLVAMASLQPVAGKLGDALGRRSLILGGVTCFGVASVGAAVAPTLGSLLVCRILQAVAGALVVPNGAALLRAVLPTEQRGGGFGMIGTAVGLAAAVGPPLGGLVIAVAGWRAMFFLNLGLVLPALLVGWRCLPLGGVPVVWQRLDMPGAVMLPLLLVGGAALLMALTHGGPSWGTGTVGIWTGVLTIVFVWHECRHASPILPPSLFRQRAFAAANAGIALSNLAMYSLLLSVPFLMETRSVDASLQSGLVLTALQVSMIALTFLGGRLTDQWGRRLPTTLGLALLTLGTVPLALYGSRIALGALLVSLILAGTGLGLSSSGLQTTPVESVSLDEAGIAAGVYATSRYLGSIVGAALLAGLVGAEQSATAGLEIIFRVVCGAALLSTLASLGLRAWPEVQRGEA